jgi:hypothetical protein
MPWIIPFYKSCGGSITDQIIVPNPQYLLQTFSKAIQPKEILGETLKNERRGVVP